MADKYITGKFNVNILGSGNRTIMFAHGLGCDQNMWRFITPSFKNDYTLILFDLAGSGNSDKSSFSKSNYSSLNDYAKDFIEVARSAGKTNITLVAHSVSCMISLLAASDAPEIFSKIVMIGPSPCYLNDHTYRGGFERREIEEILKVMKTNFESWASFFAPQVIGVGNGKELSEDLKESFCRTDPEILHHFATVTFYSDYRKELGKSKIPTMIIQSSEDIIAPVEVGEYLHQNLEASSLYVTKTTGHCPHLTAPEEIIKVMKEFLQEPQISR